MHATEFLKKPNPGAIGPMVVLFGEERSLKQETIQKLTRLVLGETDDISLTRFNGNDVDLVTVRDELLTISMWGDRRLVVVDSADGFVKEHRPGLEKYLDKPARKSVLVLDVEKWPKTTRLAKQLPKVGLEIDCSPLKGQALANWVQDMARDQHEKQISGAAVALLAELVGPHLGLLEQEVAKLVSYIGARPKIDVEDVRKLVGGWKVETTFEMINSLRDGNVGVALNCLEKLLMAGEAPARILGGISFIFKKLAQATELARQGATLHAALRQAGVFPKDIEPSSRYLRRIGRPRAEKIYRRLMEADQNLKGGSRVNDRTQMEQLLFQLSGRV